MEPLLIMVMLLGHSFLVAVTPPLVISLICSMILLMGGFVIAQFQITLGLMFVAGEAGRSPVGSAYPPTWT